MNLYGDGVVMMTLQLLTFLNSFKGELGRITIDG